MFKKKDSALGSNISRQWSSIKIVNIKVRQFILFFSLDSLHTLIAKKHWCQTCIHTSCSINVITIIDTRQFADCFGCLLSMQIQPTVTHHPWFPSCLYCHALLSKLGCVKYEPVAGSLQVYNRAVLSLTHKWVKLLVVHVNTPFFFFLVAAV